MDRMTRFKGYKFYLTFCKVRRWKRLGKSRYYRARGQGVGGENCI